MVWLLGGCLCPETVKNLIVGCSWFQKSNFDSLLLKLLICLPKTKKRIQFCVSFVDFRDQSMFHPLFGLKSQIIMSTKKVIIGHSSFMQLCHVVEKCRRKPKISVKVIQIFWYEQHVGVNNFF